MPACGALKGHCQRQVGVGNAVSAHSDECQVVAPRAHHTCVVFAGQHAGDAQLAAARAAGGCDRPPRQVLLYFLCALFVLVTV